MDYFQDHIPLLYNAYTSYYLPYQSQLRPVLSYLYLIQSYTFTYLYPIIFPLYRLSYTLIHRSFFSSNADFLTLALVVLVGLLSLKLLDMLRRQIIYWISLMVRLFMWALLLALGFWVFHRGLDQSLEDVGWVMGFLAGLEAEGERVGKRKGQQRMADSRRARAGYGRADGAGDWY